MKILKNKTRSAPKVPATKVVTTVAVAGDINCNSCGAKLEPTRFPTFDFSAWAGIQVQLADAPGFRCPDCGVKVLAGSVINASLMAIALSCVQLPHRLSADLARYLRRMQGITQQELADRMGIARETVANWECGEREISPQHDLILRGMVLQRALGEVSAERLTEILPALKAVKSEPPPRQRAGVSLLGPVAIGKFLNAPKRKAVPMPAAV